MNILITGGAGFIGSHTAVVLQKHGFRPIIIDDLSNSHILAIDGIESITKQKCTFYEGDCNDKTLLESIFEKEKIDGVIHFAALKAVGESSKKPLDYYHNNINSLLTVLKTMKAFEVSNLVFSSSATVYGDPKELPVTEESAIQPALSPYSNTKQICEEIIQDASKSQKLKAFNLRYFNPIGAHPSAMIGELPIGSPNNLVPYITQTAAGIRQKLSIFGDDYDTSDGTCVRDYIHVMDLAEAHIKALLHLSDLSTNSFVDAINIGTGKGASVKEVVDTFIEVTGVNFPHEMAQKRPGDVAQIYADPQKSKKILNWTAQYSLREALDHAWQWQKKIKKIKNIKT